MSGGRWDFRVGANRETERGEDSEPSARRRWTRRRAGKTTALVARWSEQFAHVPNCAALERVIEYVFRGVDLMPTIQEMSMKAHGTCSMGSPAHKETQGA